MPGASDIIVVRVILLNTYAFCVYNKERYVSVNIYLSVCHEFIIENLGMCFIRESFPTVVHTLKKTVSNERIWKELKFF